MAKKSKNYIWTYILSDYLDKFFPSGEGGLTYPSGGF